MLLLDRRARRPAAVVLALGLAASSAVGAVAVPATAAGVPHPQLVSATPAATTPHVSDGTVNAFAQVGQLMVVGGSFTAVRSPDQATSYARPKLAAFDASTGAVSTSFAPRLDGTVEALAPGPTAGTVLVGGRFKTVNGAASRSLTLLSVATGAKVAGWTTPVFNGDVLTFERSGSRLFVGGTFTTVGPYSRPGLATLSATTGALDAYLTSDVSVNHNWTPTSGGARGLVGVARLDITADGRRLVAIGNFKKVNASVRDQIAMWDLGATSAAPRVDWRSRGFEAPCASTRFDSYVRDVEFSPDGSYFVVVTSGGSTQGYCDSATRWESAAAGDDVAATWQARTGGDTLLSVAVTGAAVYVGGHQRWMNNASNANVANQGAVPRAGLAALDPATGMPLDWNPGRNPRGIGASALHATSAGLWVGSDTEFIGDRRYRRERVAFFPVAGGRPLASSAVPTLPGSVHRGSFTLTSSSAVAFRANAGGPPQQSRDSGLDWLGDTVTTPLRNRLNGESVSTYVTAATPDATIPAGTPAVMLQSARVDPGTKGDGKEMQWNVPVAAGTPIEVRLYFVSRVTTPGTRVFDVSVDGRKIENFDPAAQHGYPVATMKKFAYISDGNVDIDFGHEVGHPFVSGIEIIRTSGVKPAVDASLRSRTYDGSVAGPSVFESTPINWGTVRGAAMIGGSLYYGTTDSRLHRRTFDGSTWGPDVVVDPYNDPAWSAVPTGSVTGQTYRGVRPFFYLEIGDVTSMWFDGKGRLYYTLFKQSSLYYRAFSPDSGALHPTRYTVPGVTLPDITGAFLSGSSLYYVTRADGTMWRVGFTSTGALSGTAVRVSGPSVDGVEWRSRTLFLGPS